MTNPIVGDTDAQETDLSQRDLNISPPAASEQTTTEGEIIHNPEAHKASQEAAAQRVKNREDREGYEARIKELEDAEEERRRADLDDQSRLNEDLKSATEEAEENKGFKEAFNESLARRIEAIPEEDRRRIPDFDDPRKTALWLDENQDLFELTVRAANTDAGASGDKRPVLRELTDDEKQMAHDAGVTPEAYSAMIANASGTISHKT